MKATQASEARYGAPGVSGAAPLATREPANAGFLSRTARALLSWVKTATITLGVMYVLGWFVTVGGTAWISRQTRFGTDFGTSRDLKAEAMRPYALPADRAISVEQAGLTFMALQPARTTGTNGFVERPARHHEAPPWRGLQMAPSLFPEARSSSWEGPGLSVFKSVARGLSAEERRVLRMVASAPAWRDFDVVVRAPRMDLIGAQWEVPFGNDARLYEMPILRFAATKELAYAAVARAAWHLSEGRADSAESVLRAVVSFGFVIRDNATFTIEQLIGNSVTGIGRDALIEFYALTKDPRGPAIEAATVKAAARPFPGVLANRSDPDPALRRTALVAASRSPELTRATRLHALELRAFAGCSDARELAFGSSPETRSSFDAARRDLARFPSERAVIDLMEESLNRRPASSYTSRDKVSLDAIRILSRIYFNPRVETCLLGPGSYVF